MRRHCPTFVLGMLTGAGLLILGATLTGATNPTTDEIADVIRTRELHVVDQAGTVQVSLGYSEHGGTVSVREHFGK